MLRLALDRSDAVIVCGGLGPTHDDITRECIAEVMGVELERDDDIAERITQMFAGRGRRMAENNLRQADVPVGATVIPQVRGTAPGLICPVGDKVVYAVPGVPHEMKEMLARAIIPDLRRAVRRDRGDRQSHLAHVGRQRVGPGRDPRVAHRALGRGRQPDARVPRERHRGVEGAAHREGRDRDEAAHAMLAAEEREVRGILGPLVFGVDDETMESAVLDLLRRQGRSLALAESVTGGLGRRAHHVGARRVARSSRARSCRTRPR